MRFDADKPGDDHVIIDQKLGVEVEMGSLPSVPNVVVSETEETGAVQEPCRDHAVFVQRLMQASRVWQPRGRTAHRILHRNHSLAIPGDGDDRPGLCARPLTLKDHFHARFGDRTHHRFKPTPSRGIRLRKRSMSADIPGASTPTGSELVVCSGGRSAVGRGHHGPRPGRCGARHLGCHRRWFREMQVLADELEKELGQSKSAIVLQFSLDRTSKYEAQQAAAASAADIVARLSLNDYVKPPAAADNGMGVRMIEYEKPSMDLEAPTQQPELPIFEVSKLSLSDAQADPVRRTWFGV